MFTPYTQLCCTLSHLWTFCNFLSLMSFLQLFTWLVQPHPVGLPESCCHSKESSLFYPSLLFPSQNLKSNLELLCLLSSLFTVFRISRDSYLQLYPQSSDQCLIHSRQLLNTYPMTIRRARNFLCLMLSN